LEFGDDGYSRGRKYLEKNPHGKARIINQTQPTYGTGQESNPSQNSGR